jgi:hypothetical protein
MTKLNRDMKASVDGDCRPARYRFVQRPAPVVRGLCNKQIGILNNSLLTLRLYPWVISISVRSSGLMDLYVSVGLAPTVGGMIRLSGRRTKGNTAIGGQNWTASFASASFHTEFVHNWVATDLGALSPLPNWRS